MGPQFTTQPEGLQPGQEVYWLYTPRGGYGYTMRVPAIVVKVGKSRIGIAALKADNQTWVPRYVRIENLKERTMNT